MFWNRKKTSFTYKCSKCGQVHEDWPAIGYNSPWHYQQLNEQEKTEIAKLSNDFCEIQWDNQTDRFIRTVLIIPVNNFDLDLEYGLWVSVSEQSFKEYDSNFDRTDYDSGFFGWVCNKIIGYDDSLNIPTDVIVAPGTQRPILKPHQDYEHPLITDFYNGITKEEAEVRIHEVINASK